MKNFITIRFVHYTSWFSLLLHFTNNFILPLKTKYIELRKLINVSGLSTLKSCIDFRAHHGSFGSAEFDAITESRWKLMVTDRLSAGAKLVKDSFVEAGRSCEKK